LAAQSKNGHYRPSDKPGIPTASGTFSSEYLKIEISVVEEMKKATHFKYLTARVNPDVFITSKRVGYCCPIHFG
jgi:hypothetical protein